MGKGSKASIKCGDCFDTGVIGFGEDCPACDAGYAKQLDREASSGLIDLPFKRLHEDAKVPTYAHEEDAGFDLYAIESLRILPGATVITKIGLAFQIPAGYELQIRPRSGMSYKTKLRVANSPGTIDSGYIDEVGVIFDNIGGATQSFEKGDRIAQAVLVPIAKARFKETDTLIKTDRAGGFGSSGK